ncbi:MAG TPA: hypothetical protein VD929_00255 [Caulobacteraceae bacterium]|nr:hypothetical protein [Caulobacteraceae bacterium]
MSASLLTVVPAQEPQAESLSDRVRRLQAEAQSLAKQQIGTLEAKLMELSRLAEEIAQGGDAYPIGARELARRMAEDAAQKALTLEAILQKTAH